MLVEAFLSNSCVERFAKRIIRGLSRLREVECDIIGLGPEIEFFREEFGAIIDPDGPWHALALRGPFQCLDNIVASVLAPVSDGSAHTTKVIQYR